jgi:predicted transcriptional regulator
MSKKIEININSIEEAGKRFIAAWHAAEKSQGLETPSEFLTFEKLEILLKVLTPRRLTLLKQLRSEGPLSVRMLSKKLQRDYSNVHTDVKHLEMYGLIDRNDNGEVFVPWSDIIAHFSLVVSPSKLSPSKLSPSKLSLKKPRIPKLRQRVQHHKVKHHKKAS